MCVCISLKTLSIEIPCKTFNTLNGSIQTVKNECLSGGVLTDFIFFSDVYLPTFVTVPSSLIRRPSDQTVIEGAKVTFHCDASGNPSPKLTWIKDGKTVGMGERLSFEAQRNNSGKYWCLADNGVPPSTNASAFLGVHCK